jgi:hypothetical protein
VVGLANACGDTVNSIKQAAEFGIARSAQSGRTDSHPISARPGR